MGTETEGRLGAQSEPTFFRLVVEDGPWLDAQREPVPRERLPFGEKTLAAAEAWARQQREATGLRDRTGGAVVAQRAADEAEVWVMDAVGGWHEPGGEAIRARHDAVRVFGEYSGEGGALPWWGLYGWPEDSFDRLDAHDLRSLGASEDLIEAGRAFNERWEAWATAAGDEPVSWPGGPGAHAAEGEQIEAEGAALAARTARELPRLWVQDPGKQWHAGLLRIGGDGEPDGPYSRWGIEPDGALLLLDGDHRGGRWGIVQVRGGGRVRWLPAAWEEPEPLRSATEAWLEVSREVGRRAMFLDLEAIEDGDPAETAKAEELRALAEEEWRLAWEALRAMSEQLGGGAGAVELGDASGRRYEHPELFSGVRERAQELARERGLSLERALQLSLPRPTAFGARVIEWVGRARGASPEATGRVYYSGSYAPLSRGEDEIADDWEPESGFGSERD